MLKRTEWNGADPSYDTSRLTDDTLALLAPGVPLSLRMETIRRAVIYSARATGLSDRLAVRLMARTMNDTAGGRTDPIDGLTWIRQAARLGEAQAASVVAIVERARAENR